MTVHELAAALQDIPALRDLCRSIATAEAVLNPGDYRYYSFDAHWSETDSAFSMRNGSGDEFDVIFSPPGAYIRGFDHESPMSPYADDAVWPGVLDSVPDVFRAQVEEPAFMDHGMPCVTFCLWRETGDTRWHTGRIDFPSGYSDPDGSRWMSDLLVDPTPEAFQSFAEDYYECPVDLDAVRHVYAGRPLTPEIVARLNPAASFTAVSKEAEQTGYPI
ncbi:hypothetical protein [Streptomyces sp. GC420]|uniref:hypothetical protein n=1 Tax=Streptomyces sp. GC420 TaxID=2697568 RepID=UPI001414EB33|nr:hypothetical protein [Streptomyces sp. GC420]